jgi:hypothetical protein
VEIIEPVGEGVMFIAWAKAERGSMANRGIALPESPTPDQAREALEFARGTRDADWGMFVGWPDDVEWSRARATVAEIGEFRHCGYWTFRVLTNDTRLPRDAASTLADGPPTANDHNAEIIDLRRIVPEIAKAVGDGHRPEPLIAVRNAEDGKPVIAEGNKRSIAYQYAFPPDAEIEILFGTSPNMANWRFYNFA